jgi:hypothetical protein
MVPNGMERVPNIMELGPMGWGSNKIAQGPHGMGWGPMEWGPHGMGWDFRGKMITN